MEWTGLDWTAKDFTELDWSGLDSIGFDWTGLETELDWTGLVWNGLCWIGSNVPGRVELANGSSNSTFCDTSRAFAHDDHVTNAVTKLWRQCQPPASQIKRSQQTTNPRCQPMGPPRRAFLDDDLHDK